MPDRDSDRAAVCVIAPKDSAVDIPVWARDLEDDLVAVPNDSAEAMPVNVSVVGAAVVGGAAPSSALPTSNRPSWGIRYSSFVLDIR